MDVLAVTLYTAVVATSGLFVGLWMGHAAGREHEKALFVRRLKRLESLREDCKCHATRR